MFLTERGSHIWLVYYCLLSIWHNACTYMLVFFHKAYLKYQPSPSFSTSSFKVAYVLRSLSSVQFSCSVMSDSLWHNGLQYARLSCMSPAPGAYSNSCPLSWGACLNPISPREFCRTKRFQECLCYTKTETLVQNSFSKSYRYIGGRQAYKNKYRIVYTEFNLFIDKLKIDASTSWNGDCWEKYQ